MDSQQDIICYTPNILVPQFPDRYKLVSLALKEIMYSRYISYKTNYIALFHERHCACSVLTYSPFLAVWQKDRVIFDIEMDVQMEGIFHIRERLRKTL